MVVGDRDELLRVAENLIENAIKYGRARIPGRAWSTSRSRARKRRAP